MRRANALDMALDAERAARERAEARCKELEVKVSALTTPKPSIYNAPRVLSPEALKQQADVEDAKAEGWAYWYEWGKVKSAPVVDSKKFGPHGYADHDGTSDCRFDCGCSMGPNSSSGPVNPFGACPNNPKDDTAARAAEEKP
jgi:hypothetical protein